MPDEVTIETLQAEIAKKDIKISSLNAESAGHRIGGKEAKEALERTTGERDALKAQIDTLKPEAEKAKTLETQLAEATTARTAAETARTQAEGALKTGRTAASLREAAILAGIVDLDVLKLIDVATLELDEHGELKDGAKAMAKLKETKPHFFGTAPPAPRSSSNPKPDPKPDPSGKKLATEMTDAEYAALRADVRAGKIPD